MRTAFSKLDKILVRTGRYPSKRELIEDAIRTLLRAKPELKMDVAIELYKKNEVSLSRASEICGRAIASKFGIIFDSKEINRLQIPLQK